MNFLANENFPLASINLLRLSGFKVKSIAEENPGITDQEVIAIAKKDKLTIVTFDKDYGEIIHKSKVNNPPSVIFFRFKGKSPEYADKILLEILANKEISLENNFTVIEEKNIRQRKY